MEGMRLIALPTSPFAARIRIQALEKGLELPFLPPPDGMGSDALRALNPFGKIPVLAVGQEGLIESAAIQEYLEDIFPEPALRPADPLARARMRSCIRAVDLYLFPSLFALRRFQGEAGELAAVAEELERAVTRVASLGALQDDAEDVAFSLADCTMIPAIFYAERFLAGLGLPSLLERHAGLDQWWRRMGRRAAVLETLTGLEEALTKRG